MLVKKPFKTNDVVTLKLNSAEEVIATLVSDGPTSVTISKAVVMTPGPQGMAMMPWIMSAEDLEIPISKDRITVMLHTQKDVADGYTQATTNIQLVK